MRLRTPPADRGTTGRRRISHRGRGSTPRSAHGSYVPGGNVAAQDRVARPARPPATSGAGRSAVPTEGSISPGYVAQADPPGGGDARARGPAGRADSSLMTLKAKSGPGQIRRHDQVHNQDESCILTGQVTGMRSDTAVRRRRTKQPRSKETTDKRFCWSTRVVGLGGLEPPASSLSAECR
jgi:hypothetical protein